MDNRKQHTAPGVERELEREISHISSHLPTLLEITVFNDLIFFLWLTVQKFSEHRLEFPTHFNLAWFLINVLSNEKTIRTN